MELRELAERIVFGTTLADKLVRPDVLTDERPGAALPTPGAPGRPAELRFKERGDGGGGFPGRHRLDSESGRGQVLHFFANHELLATELMALVLLRFPDAPAAFRRGVARTLQDEQDHVRLYLDRMRDCGVEFGAVPVSGYFWRSVAPMGSPMDFVSGLSLTFEQANLDFSRDYARGFAEAGDATTSALLDRIHRDEIAHVAHGLKWFRRWKDPSESDWDAFRHALRSPLSPRRAKGDSLDAESRRAAGLDEDFIQRLEAFSRSKGRTPQVFLFNPLAEAFIADGTRFNPSRHQARLVADLANLPQFLAADDDIVLVPEPPSPSFLSGLRRAGLPVPEFVRVADTGSLAGRKLGGLRPWAWSPDSRRILGPLAPLVTGLAPLPPETLQGQLADLYSKAWSARFIREVLPELASLAPAKVLVGAAETGTVVESPEATFEAIAAIRARGHHRLVVKRSLGCAGGNALRLWEPELAENQRRWIADSFRDGATAVVEPWLDRIADFSVQFETGADGLRWVGYAALHTDSRGQFIANAAEPGFARRPPAAVIGAFRGADLSWIHGVFERLRVRLAPSLLAAGHRGPVGIDAFVFNGTNGPRLKPVVEINPRHTMGRLTLELMRHVAPGRHGLFRLVNPSQLRAAGHSSFAALASALAQEHPPELAGEPVPRLAAGIVPLNDPATAAACLALFQVSQTAVESGSIRGSATGATRPAGAVK